MIEHLTIRNFKSVKEVNIRCKKLNIFIGEPNSGKSNILEALALQSQNALTGGELNRNIFRYKTVSELFYDFDLSEGIHVNHNEKSTELKFSANSSQTSNKFLFFLDEKDDAENPFATIEHDGKVHEQKGDGTTNVHFYEYKRITQFEQSFMPHLKVPHGENMPTLLMSYPKLKKWVSEFIRDQGLTLTLKPHEYDMVISKFVDDELYSFPYLTLSETLQRIIFYILVLKTNNNNIIILDEPESNTFPFYTKYLSEQIALDESNQFFISTHNPYLLLSLIEKSKYDNLCICMTRLKNYQTQAIELNQEQISMILDFNSDVFFNFDKIID